MNLPTRLFLKKQITSKDALLAKFRLKLIFFIAKYICITYGAYAGDFSVLVWQ